MVYTLNGLIEDYKKAAKNCEENEKAEKIRQTISYLEELEIMRCSYTDNFGQARVNGDLFISSAATVKTVDFFGEYTLGGFRKVTL